MAEDNLSIYYTIGIFYDINDIEVINFRKLCVLGKLTLSERIRFPVSTRQNVYYYNTINYNAIPN